MFLGQLNVLFGEMSVQFLHPFFYWVVCLASGNLLYNTGSSAQCSVMTQKGEREVQEGGDICTHIDDSLCYNTETSIVKQLYSNLKKRESHGKQQTEDPLLGSHRTCPIPKARGPCNMSSTKSQNCFNSVSIIPPPHNPEQVLILVIPALFSHYILSI